MGEKKYIIFAFLIVGFAFTSFSQDKSLKRKRKSLLKEAQLYLDGEDYLKAWQNYREVIIIEPKNDLASVNGALCLVKLNYPVDSFVGLTENLKNSKLVDAAYYLAIIYHQQRSFNEALGLLQKYEKVASKKRVHSDKEIEYLSGMCISARSFIAKPNKVTIRNMGQNINSPYPDYVPVIMPDESALFFTSKREGSSNNKRNGDNNYFEDVYVSYKEEGVWKKAENAGEPLSTETNDGCVAISPDGQRMIVYRTAPDLESGDLYITRLGTNNKWEPLQLMNKEINSPYIETSACFSNDTSEIYFSSNRPGGFGGKDLYRIKKLPNGKWSPPLNLGVTVNSMYDEDAPFLHPDGVTLYFSSRGHNTMGEYDVFKSVWSAEKTNFSQAENLGYPINDVSNDIFFVLSVDGQRGYYSSVKEETFGGIDIYMIDTRFGDHELKVAVGYAYLEELPGRVKLTLRDKESGQLTGIFYSNPTNGKFIVILNPLKSYTLEVESEGYNSIMKDVPSLGPDKDNHDLGFKLTKSNAQ